jgi:hypothetical protein
MTYCENLPSQKKKETNSKLTTILTQKFYKSKLESAYVFVYDKNYNLNLFA